uniref:Uncharacterized protein n=1 Tax=Octopus bimaculoides TaxID=37653 RepID=A0A0L8I5U5_OCTBM
MMLPHYFGSLSSEMHISSATKGHAQLVKIKQLINKFEILSRIFAIAHLLY